MLNRNLLIVCGIVAALSAGSRAEQGGGASAAQPAQQQPAVPTAGAPSQQSDQPERPTFRTGINFVRVDVIVTEKGEPVTNLTQADFDLREDGKPQSIEQFRLIKIDGNPRPGDQPPRQIRNRDDEEAEAARDDVRVIVLFLDDYHTRLASGLSLKKSLIDFVQTQLRPTDLLAVMAPLTPVTDLAFTRNQAAIISAINRFEGRKFRYEARNEFERQYEHQPTEVIEQVRNRVSMSALEGLATRLGAIREGRKSVIYVSEGFTALLPPQLRRQDGTVQELAPGPLVGENNANEDRARAFATADVYSRMRDVFTVFNRNNASIYALDPRGLATGEFGIDENIGPGQDRANLQLTQDTLRMLAEQTDGKAIVSRNDLAKGLQQLIRDSSYYYLIGYTSSAPTDGKFHEIKINVKRRGLDVRGRRGFWAATTEDVARASALPPSAAVLKPIESALATLATPVQSMQYVRTWIGTERGDNGKTRVTLVWEPVTGAAGRREQVGRVSVLAATANGDVIYRGRAPEEPQRGAGPETAPAGAAGGNGGTGATAGFSPQRVVFDAPPGSIELRLSVEGAGGGVLDTDVRKVTVPDLTAPQAAMSTPRLFRARTARDFQALSRDATAVPVTTREFSRTERVLVRFDAYGAGTEMPMVTAALMNRSGQRMADFPVTPAAAGGTHQIDLGLASIAPGEYLVEITIKSGSGEAKALVPLRVVS